MAATTWVDIRTPPRRGEPLGLVAGYAGAVIEVADLDRAVGFYRRLLGVGQPSAESEGLRLQLDSGQSLTLTRKSEPRTFPETAIHRALRIPHSRFTATIAALEAMGVAVDRYHEDRDAECAENYYCADPDGNRLQLVEASETGIDHAAVETYDVEWSEVFYTQVLDARVEQRVGWTMDDFARAWAWGRGEDACAPGARRWETLYTDTRPRVPRPNAQLYFRLGPGVAFAVYLAPEHRQEPPPRVFRGTPRIAFRVPRGRLDELAERLRSIRLRCMWPSPTTGGPFERVDEALYVRDPSGNFLEFRE